MSVLDMSGANYVGRGSASLEFRLDGASGTFGQDAMVMNRCILRDHAAFHR